MLKGLMLTPPVIGRIAIGKVVQRNGKRVPEKDDEFTITSQVQNKDGWLVHPIDAKLRSKTDAKLRSIPVRLLFDDPDLNLRASYSMFERSTGRPLCVGNGHTCKRVTSSGIQQLPCPSPEGCEIAAEGRCKPFGRLNVRIEDDADELGTFIFRTTGFNSIRALTTRLRYFHAASNGMLATIPLELRLRGKSTMQSHRATIYFVDLTVRQGMSLNEALIVGRSESRKRDDAGFNQAALDAEAKRGFEVGSFEESVDDGSTIVEEFDFAGASSQTAPSLPDASKTKTLPDKLAGLQRQSQHVDRLSTLPQR